MGARCYDRQIIYLAAEKLGDSSLDIETLLKEDNSPKEHIFASMGFSGVQEITRLNEVLKKQSVVIRELAERGSAVFLGRCADVVLKDYSEHYAFFIYANVGQKKLLN